MSDSSETARRQLDGQINAEASGREALEAKYGQVWDTAQMLEDFEAIGFAAPVIVVRRRADGGKGSLLFQRSPRFYFSFSVA